MKLLLAQKCYKWLVQLKILKAYLISHQRNKSTYLQQQNETISTQMNIINYQVCYDDQIYLQNGYLIGVLLKQILKEHQLYSQKLVKVRKITVLKKNQNWSIITNVLQFMEYDFLLDNNNHHGNNQQQLLRQQQQYDQQQQQQQQQNQQVSFTYNIAQIKHILQFLYQNYGPQRHLKPAKNQRHFHIQSLKLQKSFSNKTLPYNYNKCQNLLQFMCYVIYRTFDSLNIEQCLGLLIDNGKYMKKLIKYGLKQKNYQKIEIFYQEILNNIDIFQELIKYEQHHFQHFMAISAYGVVSLDKNIMNLSCLLLQSIQNYSWYLCYGKQLFLQSVHPQVLNLLILKSKNNFRDTFNPQFHNNFNNKIQYFKFLKLFLPVLSKSIYSKQVIQSYPIQCMLTQCLQIFDQDNIDKSDSKIRNLSRQTLLCIYRNFFKRIPDIQKARCSIVFQHPNFNTLCNMSEKLCLLSNLFQFIKVFLHYQDAEVEKYFKIALRYLKKSLQLRQFVINSFKQLYQKFGRSFPLGAFIMSYQPIQVAQSVDYQIFIIISKDQSLLDDQVIRSLNIAVTYYMQINGDSFIEIIKNLLKFKQSLQWANVVSKEVLNKWSDMKLPPLLPGKTDTKHTHKSCRFDSFGVKRRQMLKFQEFQKYKNILDVLCEKKDSQFLKSYQKSVKRQINYLNRDQQKVHYKKYLNRLLQKIKFCRQTLPEPIDLPSRSLIYSTNNNNTHPYSSIKNHQSYNNNNNFSKSNKFSQSQSQNIQNQQSQNNNNKIDRTYLNLESALKQSPINKYKRINLSDGQYTDSIIHDEEEEQNEDDFNQFLNQKKQKQQQNNMKNKEFQCIKQFTQNQKQKKQNNRKSQFQLIQLQQLQNYQITYLKILQQNNQQLISKIYQIYINTCQKQQKLSQQSLKQSLKQQQDPDKISKRNQKIMISLLKQIKVYKYLPQEQTIQLWQKMINKNKLPVKNNHNHNEELQKVWNLIVQIGFLMFGFKRNTRVRIKLIQSFIDLIKNNLKSINNNTNNYLNKQNNIHKQMVFQNKLITLKYLKWNQIHQNTIKRRNQKISASKQMQNMQKSRLVDQILQKQQNKNSQVKQQQNLTEDLINESGKKVDKKLFSYLLCYEVLNDILQGNCLNTNEKSIKIGIIEPMSRIITNIKNSNELIDNIIQNQSTKFPIEQNKYQQNQNQLEKLEKLLRIQQQKQKKQLIQKQQRQKLIKSKLAKQPFKKAQAAKKGIVKSIQDITDIDPTTISPPRLQYSKNSKYTQNIIFNQKYSQNPKISPLKNQGNLNVPKFSKLQPKILKQKLLKRRQQVQNQIKSKINKKGQQKLINIVPSNNNQVINNHNQTINNNQQEKHEQNQNQNI